MKLLTRLCLICLVCLQPLQADLDQAAQSVRADLEQALQALATARAAIAEEKLPLVTELNQREAELVQLRQEAARLQRLYDNHSVDLRSLQRDVEAQEIQWTSLRSTLDEYLRSFEARIGQAEWALYQPLLRAAHELDFNPNLSFAERWDYRIDLLQAMVHRSSALSAGRTFNGAALSDEGLLVDGTYLVVGPLEFFTDGDSVTGSAVRSQTIEPRIQPIRGADDLQRTIENGHGLLWVDPTLGKAHQLEQSRDTIPQRIAKGGIWIWPILIFGLCASGIAIVKWVQILRMREPSPAELQDFATAYSQGDFQRASSLAASAPPPMQAMLQAATSAGNLSHQQLEELVFERTLAIQQQLEKGLPVLALTAATTPLLGLLGTVTGMIKTFNLIQVFGSGNAAHLASGISEALITTEFGLIVAIPALVAHAFLVRRAQGILTAVETTTNSVLNLSPNEPSQGVVR